jgi:hypothetical protein
MWEDQGLNRNHFVVREIKNKNNKLFHAPFCGLALSIRITVIFINTSM